MKFLFKNREQGSSLFVAMVICLVVGLILSGYLVLSSNRVQMTVRSSDWNAAIPVSEAGIEEALTHLTRDTGAPTANGWTNATFAGSPVYTKQRTLSDGSYYFVAITTNQNAPTIYSQAFIPSPYQRSKYISRTVQVVATNNPSIYLHAFNLGNGGYRQSGGIVVGYDPTVGAYDPVTNRLAVGGVATDSTASKAVDLSASKIYGPASTGPGGTISVSGSGAIGDVSWATNHTGVQGTAWTNNTMNVAFPTNYAPGPYSPPSTVTNITSGSYEMASYSSSGMGNMIINGNVTLVVDGTFNISGSGYLQVNPGASLTLYTKGSVTISGGGAVNLTGVPSAMTIIGTSTCTSITYSGSAGFIGLVNAPQAAFTLSGSANAIGSIVAYSANGSGGASFLYPNNLGGGLGYYVSSWKEIVPP
jgi:Tfp pilus assembly protein PilX